MGRWSGRTSIRDRNRRRQREWKGALFRSFLPFSPLEPKELTSSASLFLLTTIDEGSAGGDQAAWCALGCGYFARCVFSSSSHTFSVSPSARQLSADPIPHTDNFYKSLTPEQSSKAFKGEWDFDSPDSFDYDVLVQCVQNMKDCKAVQVHLHSSLSTLPPSPALSSFAQRFSPQIPNYSFVAHNRTSETTYLYGAGVILVEGLFVLYDQSLREILDLRIFVQCDPDLMLARRIKRDIKERGREAEGVIDQYLAYVKPGTFAFRRSPFLPSSTDCSLSFPPSISLCLPLVSTIKPSTPSYNPPAGAYPLPLPPSLTNPSLPQFRRHDRPRNEQLPLHRPHRLPHPTPTLRPSLPDARGAVPRNDRNGEGKCAA
jgi:uridine kinase